MKTIHLKPTWRKVSHLKGPLGVEEIFEDSAQRVFIKTIIPSEFSTQITARKLVGESRSKTGFPTAEQFLRQSIAEIGLPRPYSQTRTIPQVPVELHGKYATLLQTHIDQDPHTQQFAWLWLEKDHSDAANRLVHQVIPQALANQLEFAIGFDENPFANLGGIFNLAVSPSASRFPRLLLFRGGHNGYDGYQSNLILAPLLAPPRLPNQQDPNKVTEQLFLSALKKGLIWSSAQQATLDQRARDEERNPPGDFLRKLLEREQLESALPPSSSPPSNPVEGNSVLAGKSRSSKHSHHGYL